MMPLHIVILAAGQGTRMRSSLPKVLHPIAARPMLQHVLDAALALSPAQVHVVIGHGADSVRAQLAAYPVTWVNQEQQLGTGHAVQQAMPGIPDAARVLILYGDVPLIRSATCQQLLDALQQADLALLSVELAEPRGYGRILRTTDGQVVGIREDKDCTPAQRHIREGNTGLMAVRAHGLRAWLGNLSADNAQGEYYLTDVVGMAAEFGRVEAVIASDEHEVAGVNSRAQLAALERVYQAHQARVLMDEGVSLADPARLDVRGRVVAARDVFIDVNVVLEGEVVLAPNVRIGAGCVLKDVVLGEGVEIRPHSVLEGATIGAGSMIGPFARIRPGTVLAAHTHIGNYVEVKASQIGAGSKVNHLSYIGDSEIGAGCNIGAGTITCNYDGANKHKTLIGDDVFVGSDTQLVAPVSIGSGATIGAGSTITKDVEPGALALSRTPQIQRAAWKRPRKGA
ncbi:MAG: UDP-N-acetylglucosamine diphosphorylase/glucosamine-1-phosphate N-acetyltransferase [Gammaproteobacteria bacterium 28-57-27]|nr:MAG: UDP-N-acetylglucosamine diphosphorylase/glucosamine-1-phosphate N-acetyltransferase [Gammaproteobacteria bacterium 28-57-27]